MDIFKGQLIGRLVGEKIEDRKTEKNWRQERASVEREIVNKVLLTEIETKRMKWIDRATKEKDKLSLKKIEHVFFISHSPFLHKHDQIRFLCSVCRVGSFSRELWPEPEAEPELKPNAAIKLLLSFSIYPT